MYTWILSTGWWQGRAPVNPDAVVVIGFLCVCLIGGFFYINRCFIRPLPTPTLISHPILFRILVSEWEKALKKTHFFRF